MESAASLNPHVASHSMAVLETAVVRYVRHLDGREL